jgi:hypothetical protein
VVPAAEPSASYSTGSLRITLSRYISIQTFDADRPVNGKLLLMDKSTNPEVWYNQMDDTPYELNHLIGCDINFNKFKNHGIEMRFFDWFPEEYLKAVMDFLVLLSAHSLSNAEPCRYDTQFYSQMIKDCVTKGHQCRISRIDANRLFSDLKLPNVTVDDMSPYQLLLQINNALYYRYKTSLLVKLMSPHMKLPVLVNYNKIAYEKLYEDLHGKKM